MPTYHQFIYEVTSNCAEELKVVVRHDTDPRERTAELDERSVGTPDAQKIADLRAVEHYLEVTFISGVWCRFYDQPSGGRVLHGA